MRLTKYVAGLTLLALSLCPQARALDRCSEANQNSWLDSCGWALHAVRQAETPPPSDPWEFLADVRFKAEASLSDELVDACSDLQAQPNRIPPKVMHRIWPSGWPPAQDPCTRAEHLRWLRSCEQDALALTGHTRAELSRNFREEGGLSTYEDKTYHHRRCDSLKVKVQFLVSRAENESPDDVVDSVLPYIGAEIMD
jgi:hypothetical protein